MKTEQIRQAFLQFFHSKDHKVVASDSLIPSTDPSLLFSSAGMVQFKPFFQDASRTSYKRATSCQKCLRTSDIERVGHTLRHLTFFEMLGNFSFGNYFKKEAIAWAWEFLTKTMELPGDRFVVSVFKDDSEAFDMWKAIVPENRIYRLNEDTNFWTMGPTGPCGPCSEILWDRGAEWSCGKPTCSPACDCDRYLEVWNLVFTQFDRQADGKLEPLPQTNIDTGMGLERLAVLKQGVHSPFDTDAFQAVFEALSKLSGRSIPQSSYPEKVLVPELVAFRRISDHVRAITFMISDGILPSNEGRGYVLRRLLRQAVRAGKSLGIQEPFLHTLSQTVVETVKASYTDLPARLETIRSVIKAEEEKFLETLDTGTRQLVQLAQAAQAAKVKVLAGKDVFQLYDTFGFPIELTREMAADYSLQIDEAGFKAAQEEAVERARQGWKGSGAVDVEVYRDWKNKLKVAHSAFRGYETLKTNSLIFGPIYRVSQKGFEAVQALEAGDVGEVVLDQTPFYSEGGGQVGDVGLWESPEFKADVLDTQSPVEGLTVHRVHIKEGRLVAGLHVQAQVDAVKRAATMRHHTATHLLHKALKVVLGTHVAQAGSLVAPDRLRFDFTHFAPVSAEEKIKLEDLINEQILNDTPVQPHEVPIDEARAKGAVMMFGEKYGEQVRTIRVSPDPWEKSATAWSLELCGGTHVRATGQIGLVKIVSESAVSAGVRRIEAVAGLKSLQAVRKLEEQIQTVASTLKVSPDEVVSKLDKVLSQEKQLQKNLEQLQSKNMRDQFNELISRIQTVGGQKIFAYQFEGIAPDQLREAADYVRDKGQADVSVLATSTDEKISFVISLSKAAVQKGSHAGQMAKKLAAFIEGSGGGRPEFAQGGGKNKEKLVTALKNILPIIA